MTDSGPTPDLARTPDGGTLRLHRGGLAIIRRRKHEPIPVETDPAKLAELTDKIRGSKFVADWTLEAYVRWLDEFLTMRGWRAEPGVARMETVSFNRTSGVVSGRPVSAVCVRSDGRTVHAYPDEVPR